MLILLLIAELILLSGLQVRHTCDQPLAAGAFEIDLDTGLWPLPFQVEYDAITETGMVDALADK